jgi:phosphoenolpyruvate carboxykinase (ATP)
MEIMQSHPQLEELGLKNLHHIHWQLDTPQLYEQSINRSESYISYMGPLVVNTGKHTGRSPKDKFVVKEHSTENDIWWGAINQPVEPAVFDALLDRVLEYFAGKDVFVQNVYGGADPKYRLPVQIITEMAYHSLFVRNMFIIPTSEQLATFEPQFRVLQAPNFEAVPERDGVRTSTFILVNFAKKLILIGGTLYTGEIKKGIFTILNYLLPKQGVLSMHCSANEGDDGETALFFGLSGTGKTTLSSDPSRKLIGDDEHGWDEKGIFNFEGGCYAKVINLSPTGEPEIYRTTEMFGTILENVVTDNDSRRVDLDDATYTENTRASYPLSYIPNTKQHSTGGHPKNIIFLTADAFGVMPPVARLTREQAMYHFLSGYTAKVAGTEKGLGKEPQATFSACFGAVFLPLHPGVYAELLGKKIVEHDVNVWLVNTGWTGGPYGTGTRMSLQHTRSIVHAILDGRLSSIETRQESYFGLYVPVSVPDVPSNILDPRATWSDPAAYDDKAHDLAHRFVENFQAFADQVSPEVIAAGPFPATTG